MWPKTRVLYRSANGDRWRLACHQDSGRVFVQHEANMPSGGRVTQIEIADFLAQGLGPEQEELLRLIGTLIDGSDAEDASANGSEASLPTPAKKPRARRSKSDRDK